MKYEIRWIETASKALSRLDLKAQRRVAAAVEALAYNPRPFPQSKKIEPFVRNERNLRIGIHFRVRYTVDDAAKIVWILDASTRENA